MFISEIFATKNCAKTKEIGWPQKPQKVRKKQNPPPLRKNWLAKPAQQAWFRGDVISLSPGYYVNYENI
jgi:hypothetical protein